MNRTAIFATVFLILAVGWAAYGQEYKVGSFEAAPGDISARVNSRVGANGRKCALLKVFVPDRIDHANGSAVGDIVSKGMEKWVYMAHDSKQVELVFDNHFPLHIVFDDYNVPVLTEQTVYVLKLVDANAGSTPAPQSANMQSPSGMAAQVKELNIKDIRAQQTDLSASVYSRTDMAGKACALVKVAFAQGGAEFEGSVIGAVEYKAGEYWVYITSGSKYLKMKHADYTPLMIRFDDTNVGAVESKKVYEVKVAGGAQAQTVTFKITPPDAILTVDQKEYPTVNGVAEITLSPEEHTYMVVASGYKGQGSKFMVYENNSNKIFVELERKSGSSGATRPSPAPAPAESLSGSIADILQQGTNAYNEGYYDRALTLFKEISDDKNAARMIGIMYYNGQGVPQDYAEAYRWFTKAAEQGDANALSTLGLMYQNGQGVAKNYTEAVRYFRKAAELDDANGQVLLGYMYREGKGVSKDYTEAARWFQRAAEKGFPSGQLFLGLHYYEGHGVPKDKDKARYWLRLAADQGDKSAISMLKIVK